MKKTFLTLLCTTLISAMVIAGCGKKKETKVPSTTLDKIKAAKEITIGTSPDYPPFESIDDKGNIIGFDIDLAKAIAKEIGAEAKFVSMGFDTIITAVKNGQVNLGMSSFSVNKERKMSIDFSKPYISTAQVILVKKGSTYKTKEDLTGKVVAAQIGTTGAEAAKTIKGATVKITDDNNIAAMMLENGSVDAVVLDIAIAKELSSRKDFRYIDSPLNHEETAIVIKKGDDSLKEAVNMALDKIIASNKYKEIKNKWKIK